MGTIRKNVALSFGLLTVAVNVKSAIVPKARNVTVCTGSGGKPSHDPVRIRQYNSCTECGTVEFHEIKRAREAAEGLVVLTDEDREELAATNEETKLTMRMTPHPVEPVDQNTAPGEKAYFLECVPGHEQSFTVLKHLVEAHPELAFMLKYSPRTSMGVYRVLVRDGALLIQERIDGERYSEAPETNPIEVPEALLAMGEQVLNLPGVIVDFDLAAYRDATEDKIAEIVASRTPQTEIVTASDGKKVTPAPARNAMSALEAMLAGAPKPAKRAARKKVS
jgi:non-homologous end joining protein Ku